MVDLIMLLLTEWVSTTYYWSEKHSPASSDGLESLLLTVTIMFMEVIVLYILTSSLTTSIYNRRLTSPKRLKQARRTPRYRLYKFIPWK